MAMKPEPEGDQAGEKENEEDQLKTEADGEEDEPPSIYVNNERGEDYQDQIGMPDEYESVVSCARSRTSGSKMGGVVRGKYWRARLISAEADEDAN